MAHGPWATVRPLVLLESSGGAVSFEANVATCTVSPQPWWTSVRPSRTA